MNIGTAHSSFSCNGCFLSYLPDEQEAKLNYRLVFMHPESGRNVATINLVCADADAAVARFREIAGFMAGELWQGETRLIVISPKPVQFHDS